MPPVPVACSLEPFDPSTPRAVQALVPAALAKAFDRDRAELAQGGRETACLFVAPEDGGKSLRLLVQTEGQSLIIVVGAGSCFTGGGCLTSAGTMNDARVCELLPSELPTVDLLFFRLDLRELPIDVLRCLLRHLRDKTRDGGRLYTYVADGGTGVPLSTDQTLWPISRLLDPGRWMIDALADEGWEVVHTSRDIEGTVSVVSCRP